MFEVVLGKLPDLLTIWASVLLCWGVYISAILFQRIDRTRITCPETVTFGCLMAASIILVLYLAFEPLLAQTAGDAIIVINVFYSAFLAVFSTKMKPVVP